jgi:pyruvate,water dikinase
MAGADYTLPFADIGLADLAQVGGKNASLGELTQHLSAAGVRVPEGFAITAQAFRDYLIHNRLDARIHDTLAALDRQDTRALEQCAATIRRWIREGELPTALSDAIESAYAGLSRDAQPLAVAVRSSATAEDLPDASFAGEHETLLNVQGLQALLGACKRVYASLYTARAIAYRADKGFAHDSVALSIGVQHMVRSDLGCAGVMFTLDTESGFRGVVTLAAAYGLGETLVQGAVNPDEYLVFKPTLAQGKDAVIRRRLGDKALKLIYAEGGGRTSTRLVPVRAEQRARYALSDAEVLELARQAVAIEAHYSARAGHPQPMDIEWAQDGASGELFIVQARPETVHAARKSPALEVYTLERRGEAIVTGRSVGARIGGGRARILLEAAHMHELAPGEVLVTDMTDPDWEPVMRRASAIVTNRGGRVCHAAIVARELGIPAVVGTGNATQRIGDGVEVTVSCAEGETGYVYAGMQPFHVDTVDATTLPRPRTRIQLIVADPDQALALAQLPNAGVGLARLEFIIANTIGVHPAALLDFDALDAGTRDAIRTRMAGHDDPVRFYVDKLSEGIATIAAAFYPKPVVVRLSDFKSNEYAALLGGERYEPHEENPMLGLRGAARYFSSGFARCFALECAAIKRVREAMGLANVEVMIPFARTVAEVRAVLELMRTHGLERGAHGLNVRLMCEIPANALLADDFLAHCDGFSIGSNDLTQLTLGADRDSGLLSGLDERDPAVLALMQLAITACHKASKPIGICGQAPSDFPEITRWLIEQGIDSIALNPDSLIRMTHIACEAEQMRPAPITPSM